MVAIGHARLEARAHAGLQQMFARVVNQGDLALENENKLVLILMPVAVRGPGAGSQGREVHPKLRQVKNIPQAPASRGPTSGPPIPAGKHCRSVGVTVFGSSVGGLRHTASAFALASICAMASVTASKVKSVEACRALKSRTGMKAS